MDQSLVLLVPFSAEETGSTGGSLPKYTQADLNQSQLPTSM